MNKLWILIIALSLVLTIPQNVFAGIITDVDRNLPTISDSSSAELSDADVVRSGSEIQKTIKRSEKFSLIDTIVFTAGWILLLGAMCILTLFILSKAFPAAIGIFLSFITRGHITEWDMPISSMVIRVVILFAVGVLMIMGYLKFFIAKIFILIGG